MSNLSTLTPLLSVSGSAVPLALASAFVTDKVTRLQAIREDVRGWQRTIEAATRALRQDAQTVATSAQAPMWDNLDELIDLAAQVERSLAADHARIGTLADDLIARAGTLPPSAAELCEDIARTALNVHADHIEALRDARWELMAHRAEREPPPEPVPAAAFDAYLDRLLGG